jgi:hypothetical protein
MNGKLGARRKPEWRLRFQQTSHPNLIAESPYLDPPALRIQLHLPLNVADLPAAQYGPAHLRPNRPAARRPTYEHLAAHIQRAFSSCVFESPQACQIPTACIDLHVPFEARPDLARNEQVACVAVLGLDAHLRQSSFRWSVFDRQARNRFSSDEKVPNGEAFLPHDRPLEATIGDAANERASASWAERHNPKRLQR